MSMELVKTEQPPEQQANYDSRHACPCCRCRTSVVFPYMIVPLFVNRERSTKAVDQALAENRMIMLVAQKESQRRRSQSRQICTTSEPFPSSCGC